MVNLYKMLIILTTFFMLIYSCGSVKSGGAFSMQDAKKFFSAYENTLKSGIAEEIKKYWSEKSQSRRGFDVMHLWTGGMIHIRDWKSFFDNTSYTYKINDLLEEDGFFVITGRWIETEKESGLHNSQPMTFYIVNENNEWLLSNPIDILTKDWGRHETENIIFYYPKEVNIDDHLFEIRLLDQEYQSMCRAMDFHFDHKIEYYKASSPEDCGRLLTQPPFNGLAAVTFQDSIPWFKIAVSTAFYNPHEVMHIIALSAGVPFSIPVFSEGIAVAYGGTTFQTAQYAHNFSKNILGTDDYIPIKKLLSMQNADFLRKNYITYQESGSFLRYLIEKYSIDKLKKFIFNFNIIEDLNEQSVKVYGTSLDVLEKNWHEYLKKTDVPEIGFKIPDNAELIFTMDDPENDDQGDGDYKYPSNKKFIKGSFDLKNLQVFKDKNNVYFRIKLQNVIDPVINRPGGSQFIPAAVIAVNKGLKNSRQLFKYTNDIRLPEGYDFKINAGFGINISNNLGKIFVSTKDFYSEMSDKTENTLTFSVPIELIGEPSDGWKYFAGIGLTDKPSFNFSGLIPVFKRNIPVLISGGNSDSSNPAFIDILLTEKYNQTEILSDYDSEKGKPASVKMISKTEAGF